VLSSLFVVKVNIMFILIPLAFLASLTVFLVIAAVLIVAIVVIVFFFFCSPPPPPSYVYIYYIYTIAISHYLILLLGFT